MHPELTDQQRLTFVVTPSDKGDHRAPVEQALQQICGDIGVKLSVQGGESLIVTLDAPGVAANGFRSKFRACLQGFGRIKIDQYEFIPRSPEGEKK